MIKVFAAFTQYFLCLLKLFFGYNGLMVVCNVVFFFLTKIIKPTLTNGINGKGFFALAHHLYIFRW